MNEISSEEKRRKRRVFVASIGAFALVVAGAAIIAVWFGTGAMDQRTLVVSGVWLIVALFSVWRALSIWTGRHH